MTQIIEFLKEWTVNFAKNKDIFTKTIAEIKPADREIVILHKHKEHKYFLDPFLEHYANDLKSLRPDSHSSIVCFNTRDNFRILVDKWNDFISFSHLSFIFVNPFAHEQKVWIIFPHTHNNIADPDSLKLGLQTMFEQVESLDRKKVEEVYS